MLQSFRLSMAWLHTWFGLVLGFILIIVFFFGSLSVFDREIDRWAVPETRFAPQIMPSFDTVLAPIFRQMTPNDDELAKARARVNGPLPSVLPMLYLSAYTTHRDPVLRLYGEFSVPNNLNNPDDQVYGSLTIDPRSGSVLSQDRLNIGSEFYFPMHYGLHITWNYVGYWLVGFATLAMLAALVSGVVIHRKLFRELFTFRPQKRTQRSILDLHNLTGVVALPFHFVFALSGLIIFASVYLPVSSTQLAPLAQKHAQQDAVAKGLPFNPTGTPAILASVDAMVAEAKRRWAERGMPGEVGFLTITHVNDSNSYVSLYRAGSDRVSLVGQGVHFEGTSGRVLYEEPAPSIVAGINQFLTGLHLQHFEHWLLRWLYVLGGLLGCICIATGFIFFVEKRKQQHARLKLRGARWVDAFATTCVTGMLIATVAILVANRLLPIDLPQRTDWEKNTFWLAWVLTFFHAAWRSGPVQQARLSPAWREQCWMLAGLAVLAVILNAVTTGDHLIKTVIEGYWPVAGLDLVLLVSALISAKTALLLRRREQSALLNTSKKVALSRNGVQEVAHG